MSNKQRLSLHAMDQPAVLHKGAQGKLVQLGLFTVVQHQLHHTVWHLQAAGSMQRHISID
jgi:hypothetical protein